MDAVLKNELTRLAFMDPDEAMKMFGLFRTFSSARPAGRKLRDWRHHKLENYRESQEAALFACALKATGLKPNLEYAHYPQKDRDFDAVLRWGNPDSLQFATVQLKEVVPEDLCPTATLEAEIAKFKRYRGSRELIGAILVNRRLTFALSEIRISPLELRELWIHGFSDGDRGLRHNLYGDFMGQPRVYEFPPPSLRWEPDELPWRRAD